MSAQALRESHQHASQLSCTQARHWLPDFLNGRLSTEEAQQVRWHLNHCAICGHVVRSARETLRRILRSANPNRALRGPSAA